MLDNSYQPKIYRKQGGDDLVIANGGKVYTEGSDADAGLSAFWDDCPRLQMRVDPTIGHFTGDDFQSIEATAHGYEITLVGSGALTKVAAKPFGEVLLYCAAADNDAAIMASGNDAGGLITANATQNWWFEARVKLSQITAAQGAFVGLGEETGVEAGFLATDTMAIKVVDALGFHLLAATDVAAIWRTTFALNGGATVALQTGVKTAVADAYVKLGMKSVLGTITFYVDGIALATTTTTAATNFPLDQCMEAVLAKKTGKAAISSMTVDWWFAAQLR
jgi:hypothetical protein